MAFSTARANMILNDLYRTDTVYLALFTTNPTAAGTGQEVTGGGYERQPITFSSPATETGKQTIKNSMKIEFPVAYGDWGTITHIGIYTAATGGDFISFGALTNSRTIMDGDRFVIDLNNGVITLV